MKFYSFARTVVLVIILLSCFKSIPQNFDLLKHPYPKSIIELGLGLGPNYGIFGGQMLVGYKGSGLTCSLEYDIQWPPFIFLTEVLIRAANSGAGSGL